MNGIINVLKPPGMTSHDVVYFIRKKFRMKKVGHTGTLDPEAAGVLPVCIGKGTKTVQYLTDKVKRYRANIKFGVVTETYDKYGAIVETRPVPVIDRGRLEAAAARFRGEIEQLPPMYSAIKYNGKKLYQYALEGETVELQTRRVEIYSLDIVDMPEPDEAVIDVTCSKGTYIRSLCYDIGMEIGCGAYMSQLIRLESSPFSIAEAYTLEEIEAAAFENRLEELIKPVDRVFCDYRRVDIKNSARSSVVNGNPLYEKGMLCDINEFETDSPVRLYDGEEFLAVGVVRYSEEEQRKYIKIKNLFI